jgi:hypothetical protein
LRCRLGRAATIPSQSTSKKLLEAGSRNTGTRTAEIIVDNFNISPAELTGALNKRILAPFAFKVVCNLICSRLPDINNGLTR